MINQLMIHLKKYDEVGKTATGKGMIIQQVVCQNMLILTRVIN